MHSARNFVQYVAGGGYSACLLFADLEKAYDIVVRETAVGCRCTEGDLASQPQCLGLDGDDVQWCFDFLCALVQRRAPSVCSCCPRPNNRVAARKLILRQAPRLVLSVRFRWQQPCIRTDMYYVMTLQATILSWPTVAHMHLDEFRVIIFPIAMTIAQNPLPT